jgi:hypothetical protein
MSIDKSKLAKVAESERFDLDLLRRKASDQVRDVKGSVANNLASSLRLIGVADYVLKGDRASFLVHLKEAALLRKQLFDRFDSGDEVSPSYVSMLSYKALFNALAAGDIELARGLAGKMGGRETIEDEYDHPFDRALGYTLKSFVLGDASAARSWLAELATLCSDRQNADFRGYYDVFFGIQAKDLGKAQIALATIAQGHRNQCKAGGVFKDSEDELLSVWGLGVANLARISGLSVESPDPLIPADLLLP